jgi:hypothetical protein
MVLVEGGTLMRARAAPVILLAALTVIAACEEDTVSPPAENNTTWWLEPDSTNLGILVLDYLSYDLEGGRLDHYAACDDCDRDSIPFQLIYRPPIDLGYITFVYTHTGDTVLHATTVWGGRGKIEFPDQFLPSSEFELLPWRFAAPMSVEYFVNSRKTDPFETADTAWSRVASLDIVGEFARSDYRVGIYHHGASHATYDPAYDSWVIFLYRGRSEP